MDKAEFPCPRCGSHDVVLVPRPHLVGGTCRDCGTRYEYALPWRPRDAAG